MNFELGHVEPMPDAKKEEMARVLLARFGLLPRKKDGTAKFHSLLLELYEKKKIANREKRPEEAVMTVEEMGLYAGIKRQTMYDYLGRWVKLNVLKKTSFVKDSKKIIGYELNGSNLEGAFRKAEASIKSHLDQSFRIIDELQNEVKKDKLRKDPENVHSQVIELKREAEPSETHDNGKEAQIEPEIVSENDEIVEKPDNN